MRIPTILIADDDEEEQEIMAMAFAEVGYPCQLHFFINGQDLMDQLVGNQEVPELIILDMNMPGKDGLSTLKEIRELAVYSKVPVVIYTNSSAPSHIQYCKLAGCTDYILKPSVYSEVIDSLKKIVAYCG